MLSNFDSRPQPEQIVSRWCCSMQLSCWYPCCVGFERPTRQVSLLDLTGSTETSPLSPYYEGKSEHLETLLAFTLKSLLRIPCRDRQSFVASGRAMK